MVTCSADECTRPVYAAGVCTAHYFRRRRGSAASKPIQQRAATFEERLAAYVQVTGFCWLWTGTHHARGYGVMSTGLARPKQKYAHVLVYETLVGPVPDGLELDHLCRVKACVNPDHVEPVTHAENMRRWALYC